MISSVLPLGMWWFYPSFYYMCFCFCSSSSNSPTELWPILLYMLLLCLSSPVHIVIHVHFPHWLARLNWTIPTWEDGEARNWQHICHYHFITLSLWGPQSKAYFTLLIWEDGEARIRRRHFSPFASASAFAQKLLNPRAGHSPVYGYLSRVKTS